MKVIFRGVNRVGEAQKDETVLDVARRAGAPLGNSCGGIGVCMRCIVRVINGSENLSPLTSIEEGFMPKPRIGNGERLACQAVVKGDCEVTTSYW